MSSELQTLLIKESKFYNYGIKQRCFMRKDSINLNGKKFGRLTPKSSISIKGKRGLYWKCECDCGKDCLVYGGHLRAGRTKSCGCIPLDRLGESAKNDLFGRYKYKSKIRNISFLLKRSDFEDLISSACFYCGSPPISELKNTTLRKTGFYNGIDRKDNSKGYVSINCVPCCKICNVMKQSLSFDEFIAHMKRIIKNVE